MSAIVNDSSVGEDVKSRAMQVQFVLLDVDMFTPNTAVELIHFVGSDII